MSGLRTSFEAYTSHWYTNAPFLKSQTPLVYRIYNTTSYLNAAGVTTTLSMKKTVDV